MKKSELRKIIREVISEQMGMQRQTPRPTMTPNRTKGAKKINFNNFRAFQASMGSDPLMALRQAGMPQSEINSLIQRYERETGGGMMNERGMLNEKVVGFLKWVWKNRRWIGATLAGYVLGDGE